jgi:hypothetical protein
MQLNFKSMRHLVLLYCFFISVHLCAQNVKTPDQFLGYTLGEKFTYHHKIVSYFKEIYASVPAKVKLENYGYTNEGRELMIAIVSTPENISRIDAIRKNNLRLAGLLKDKPGDVDMPAVIWLSYNVHGNEASSSEVSMKTLYELVSGNNTEINVWLKNTVVIIDPCLNPDGRDRYVNWYNQVVGSAPVANILSREHDEPWPGGRTNHYNFDLNRDWAWQTQIETQQRVSKYNDWMPSIHCDYHEQSYASPYYFAPAAEPYHEVITPWQREFQTAIGKNHARYFDANGWLYFTKEIFDLFYPAYGDTYPTYNGSIGMTYEQAGLSKAGLAVAADGDTLKLSDRIAHHFTTSISTIEIAALNYRKINQEFKKYFDAVVANGVGEYKSFIIPGVNAQKLDKLKNLLNKNGIIYSYAKSGLTIKGLRYFSGKDENYTTTSSDIVINTTQSKGVLIKVLFEKESKLSDSATYDITAWSLPYAYGLDCYAVKEKITGQNISPLPVEKNYIKNSYAFLAEYNSFEGGRFLAALLKNNINVRYAEKDFFYGGKKFKKGTLVVLKKGNELNVETFIQLADKYKMNVTSIQSGFMESGFDFGSDKLVPVNKPVVAIITGESVYAETAGELWHLFDKELEYPVILLNAANISNVNLKDVDVIIIPNGNYKSIPERDNALKQWVRQGGKLIALENAVAHLAGGDWGFKLKNGEPSKNDENWQGYQNLKRYENRERDWLTENTPGAIYKVYLDDSNPIAFGYPDFYYSLKMNTNLLEFSKDSWNIGVLKKDNFISGFVGSTAKESIKDGAVIASNAYGSGTVVCFVDNPVFRSFWENGKLLLSNAVFLSK